MLPPELKIEWNLSIFENIIHCLLCLVLSKSLPHSSFTSPLLAYTKKIAWILWVRVRVRVRVTRSKLCSLC